MWFIDEKRDITITKKLLFSGVQFCDYGKIYNGYISDTRMKWFLDVYFSNDIIPSKIEEPILYLVNFSGELEKFYPAYEYEEEGILRELYTNIELVPEYISISKEDTLKYHSKKTVDALEYFSYMNSQIENDSKKYLDYLFELCVLGNNEEIYVLYEEEYKKREVFNKVESQGLLLIK